MKPTEAVLALHQQRPNQSADSSKEITKNIHSAVLRMQLVEANPTPQMAGLGQLPGIVNYFQGTDPEQWRTGIPTYARVKYEEVYPGIDLIYYGNQQQLEYDFVVAPGADPNTIRLAFQGIEALAIDAQGELVLQTTGGDVRFNKPLIYQELEGVRKEVPGDYVLKDRHQIGFQVAHYDATKPLIIDPVLSYSTYLGGTGNDYGNHIAVDLAGNAYIVGSTSSIDFPTENPLQTFSGGGSQDAFVAKLNATGSGLIYSTYLGGSGIERGRAIAVDAAGNTYVTGVTNSSNFPTVDPLQPFLGGNDDAFVAKLDAAGSELIYSTYLGGSDLDQSRDLTVDSLGNAYVTGDTASTDFPVTAGAFQTACSIGDFGCGDTFVSKLNTEGSSLDYSTYLGGSQGDGSSGVAVDTAGNAYVTGATNSTDFPVTGDGFQTTCFVSDFGFCQAGYVTKLNAPGDGLVYSTYLDGNDGQVSANDIAVDSSGNAYVTGFTGSIGFPTENPFQMDCADCDFFGDAFVTKLDAAGSALVYSTFLGGNSVDFGNGIAVNDFGNAYVVGRTRSTDFPTKNPSQTASGGSGDAFVTKLNVAGNALVYSTYLGGSDDEFGNYIAVDASGNAYVTGQTASIDFPVENPLQTFSGGGIDAFVAKIGAIPIPTATPPINEFPAPESLFPKLPQFIQDHGNAFSTETEEIITVGIKHFNSTPALLFEKTPALVGDNGKEKSKLQFLAGEGAKTLSSSASFGGVILTVANFLTDGIETAFITGCASFCPESFVKDLATGSDVVITVSETFKNLTPVGLTKLFFTVYVTGSERFLVPKLEQFSEDPLDPDFMKVVAPDFTNQPAIISTGNQEIDQLFNELYESTFRAGVFLQAVNVSFDRYAAAYAAGDAISAALQISAILEYLRIYDNAIVYSAAQSEEIIELLLKLGGSDAVYDPDILRQIQEDLSVQGFPTVVMDFLSDIGLTGTEINSFKQNLLALNPDDFSGSVFTIITNTSSALKIASTSSPRLGDLDGDGIPDAEDNCPLVANADSSDVNVTRGGFRFNRRTRRFLQAVTLTNTNAVRIQGPVSLVLDDLSPNAALHNKTGDTACADPLNSPYINVSVGADNALDPDESATVVLEFTDSTNQGITYNTRVLAGPGDR